MSPQEQLNMMGKQLEMVLKQLADLRKMVSPKNGGAPKVVYKPVVVGVKDVSSAQLFDAYKKGAEPRATLPTCRWEVYGGADR